MCQICAQFNPFLSHCEYQGLTTEGGPEGGGPAAMLTGQTLTEGSDAAGGIGTAYSMGVGDVFFGTLGTGLDHDWVAVSLEAGQTYTFGLVGTGALDDAANDTYLRLRSSAGTQIDFDDDDGPGRNSAITFTASTTGTYYLDVGSYVGTGLLVGDSGTYGLSMVLGDRPSYDVTMGAGNLLRPQASWAATPGTGSTVTWAIRSSGDDGNGFIAPSAAQVAAIESITGMFDGISGLNFNQVNPGGTSNSASMLFAAYSANDGSGAYAYYPGSTASSSDAGDVWLNNNSVSQTSLPIGSFSHFAIMHEIGHAVGLAHPGDYNAGSGGPITYANSAQFTEDTHQYTVMSYFDESNTTGSFGSYPDTLMLYDILALHQLYGADMSFHSGNTTYGFNATVAGAYDFTTNTDPFLTIWDGGGTDTLDLSGYSMAQSISLIAGTFSDIGGFSGNLSIAIGAVIENAVGGAGGDTITGNGADNVIDGGGGSDTVVMALNAADATVTAIAGGHQVVSALGTDTLIGVEFIQFLDQILDLSTVAAPPPPPPPPSGPTPGDDVLSGTGGDDTVDLLAGDDSYSAGAGDDSVLGGAGNDTLDGGANNDTLRGGADNDVLVGGTQEDVLYGDGGNDTLFGNAGLDRLEGGAGNDHLDGGDQADNLLGGAGNDTLMGGNGFDRLFGQEDDDLIYGGGALDSLYGQEGNDRLFGQDGNDGFWGGQGNDFLDGGADNDRMIGGAGFDTLLGSTGNDTLIGAFNADTFVFADFGGGFGNDVIEDFEVHNAFEKIDLSRVSGISDLADLIANHMNQMGANVVIDDGSGNTITLLNTLLADVQDGNDFIF